MRLLTGLRRDLVCRQVVELLTDYLEGALPRGQRRRLEAHLAGCPHCSEYLAQLRATIGLAGTIGPGDLSPEMEADLTAIYRTWRAEQREGGDE